MRDLNWNMDENGTVNLKGDITETADFNALLLMLEGSVVLDLSGVTRINSTGVREWIHFIRQLEEGIDKLTLMRCSIAIVEQMNMIANFAGSADVVSVYAPFLCPSCEADHNELVDVVSAVPDVDARHVSCPQCEAKMEFDDLPEDYFAFRIR